MNNIHHILFWDNTTNTKHLFKYDHNYSNLAQSQILFYVYQLPMVPDYGTQYEEDPSSNHAGIYWDD